MCDFESGKICSFDRRAFLRRTASFCLVGSLPSWATEARSGFAEGFWHQQRVLNMVHVSGERLKVVFWRDGQIVQSGYEEASWFMRDRVAGEAVYMDLELLNIAYGIGGWLTYFGIADPTVLTSGHRNFDRNRLIEGAAQNSEHPKGKALDIRIPGVSSVQVAKFGLWLGGGGVGWYPGKNFTHIDSGRVRSWRG